MKTQLHGTQPFVCSREYCCPMGDWLGPGCVPCSDVVRFYSSRFPNSISAMDRQCRNSSSTTYQCFICVRKVSAVGRRTRACWGDRISAPSKLHGSAAEDEQVGLLMYCAAHQRSGRESRIFQHHRCEHEYAGVNTVPQRQQCGVTMW